MFGYIRHLQIVFLPCNIGPIRTVLYEQSCTWTLHMDLNSKTCSRGETYHLTNSMILVISWAWWLIGRFVAFCPKGQGFGSRYGHHVGTLGKSFTRSCLWRFGVKLRHSIRAVSGAPLSSSRLEEAQ